MTEDKKLNLNLFGLIYFFIFAIAVLFNDGANYLKFPKTDDLFWAKMWADIALGFGVGMIVVGLGWVLTKKIKALQDLFQQFYILLGGLHISEIFFISVFSSLAEEFFFRGLIQGKLGLTFASLFFGVLHSGPGKKYLPWTIFALVMGFVLGGLYEWRQNLILPVVIHFVVNFCNLILLQKMQRPKIEI